MKSKEDKHEFEGNEVNIHTCKHSTGVTANNSNGLYEQVFPQRTLRYRFSVSDCMTDESLGFKTKNGTSKNLSYDLSPNSGSSNESSLTNFHLCLPQ